MFAPFFRNRCISGRRGLQHEKKSLRIFGQGPMARMNHIDVAPQAFRVRDPNGNQDSLLQIMHDRDLRKKGQAQLAFHHSPGGFYSLYFEDHVGKQACPAK